MIEVYRGELLFVPWALELSQGRCSNGCAYCFANLNSPDRGFDVKKLCRQVKNADVSKSMDIANKLIRERFVLLVSNRSDMFAKSNARHYEQTMEAIKDFPLTYQTKAGINNELAKKTALRGNEHWYVSIPYMNDEIRKEIEPNTASITERLDFIDYLFEHKNDVAVSINPYHNGFISDKELHELLKILANKGVKSVSVNNLHLNPKQKNNMTTSQKIAIEKYNGFAESNKRERAPSFWKSVNVLRIAKEYGIDAHFLGSPFRSDYFKKCIELYGYDKTFPTWQEFQNFLYDDLPDGGEVYFEDFMNWCNFRLFNFGFSHLERFIYVCNQKIWRETDITKIFTLRDVIRIIWNNFGMKSSPLRSDSIFYKADSKGKAILDSEKNHIYIFKPINVESYGI